jgi:glyoxylase-like metal-dependent hydrolase (beta-lactamase superfamily II)
MVRPFPILPLFLVLLAAGAPLAAPQNAAAPVTFTKVSDRVYQALGGRGAQTGFVIGDDCVLVVDAKMDRKSQEDIFAEIARLTPKPVKYLVNTHGDADHINGNRYFPPTVAIIAHEGCRGDFLLPGRGGAPSEWAKPELAPFVPAITFLDRMNLHLGGVTVELHSFGAGHTTGDAVVYLPSEKIAFTGDQVSLPRAVYIHAYKGGNSFGHVRNLERMLASLDADRFVTGHNGVTDRAGV